jgi:hypothetical protein
LELAGQGHVGYPEPGAVEHTTKLVEINQKIVEEAVHFGVEAGTVVREAVDGEPWLYPHVPHDLQQIRASIRKVLDLRPSRIFVGHGGPFDPAAVASWLDWTKA